MTVLLKGKKATADRLFFIKSKLVDVSPKLAIVYSKDLSDDGIFFTKYLVEDCQKLGVGLEERICFPDNILSSIKELNIDPDINGILITHPFSRDPFFNERIVNSVNPYKDVEGLRITFTVT